MEGQAWWFEASDIKWLKELEHENSKLKRLDADMALENSALKDVLAKKTLTPAERRKVVTHMVTQGGLSVQRECQAVGLSRAAYDQPVVEWVRRDASVIEALTTLGATRPRWGSGHTWAGCGAPDIAGTVPVSFRIDVAYALAREAMVRHAHCPYSFVQPIHVFGFSHIGAVRFFLPNISAVR